MFLAAARTIAESSPAKHDPEANLLAPLAELRKLSFQLALAVGRQAQADGVADRIADEILVAAVRAKMWEPLYATYRRKFAPTPYCEHP